MRARGLLLGAGLLVAAAAVAHDGRELFAQRCAGCHGEARVLAALQPLGNEAAVRTRLEELLPRHHAPDHAVHEPLIVYLLGRLRP